MPIHNSWCSKWASIVAAWAHWRGQSVGNDAQLVAKMHFLFWVCLGESARSMRSGAWHAAAQTPKETAR